MGDHLTDEDLILHFYGEARGDEARIDGHLAGCDSCRTAWGVIRRTLTLADRADVPEPGPEFERVVWARVQPRLPAPGRAAWWAWPRVLAPAAALVAIAALAGTATLSLRRAPAAAAAAAAPASAAATQASERVLLTALDSHFQATQVLLVELMNAPERARVNIGFERAAAAELVEQNRLYHQTAQQNGDLHLAQLLEELDPVLVDVARGPAELDKTDFSSLRARISDQSLLFKVRALSDDIAHRQQTAPAVKEGTS